MSIVGITLIFLGGLILGIAIKSGNQEEIETQEQALQDINPDIVYANAKGAPGRIFDYVKPSSVSSWEVVGYSYRRVGSKLELISKSSEADAVSYAQENKLTITDHVTYPASHPGGDTTTVANIEQWIKK